MNDKRIVAWHTPSVKLPPPLTAPSNNDEATKPDLRLLETFTALALRIEQQQQGCKAVYDHQHRVIGTS